jgi:hypothetical protein
MLDICLSVTPKAISMSTGIETFLAVNVAPPHGFMLKQQVDRSAGMSLTEATSNLSGASVCAHNSPASVRRKVDVII